MSRRLFPTQPALLAPIRKRTCESRASLTAVGILALLALTLGCSRPQQPPEEIDWGQPRPAVVRQAPRREPRDDRRKAPVASESPSAAPSGGSDSGTGAAGHSGDGDDSSGGGDGGGGEASDAPPAPRGAGQSTGTDGDGPGGASDAPPPMTPDSPQPALPGREPVTPTLSAEEAADSATQLLKRAQQLLRAADRSAAAATAIEAYDQVLPHAESSKDCKKLCQQLEAFLAATGRRQGPADDVPTRFE